MGALHQGHMSLLTEARKQGAITVCSIFINPTQFNNLDDFQKYPTTIEADINLLTAEGCDLLFLPSVEEIYPPVYEAPVYNLGNLETILEGVYRPGHFQGVCQVVDRLLQIIIPDTLLLGQKDYQQCKVIEQLLITTGRESINLLQSPTIREADGLAMSSRNLRLQPDQRQVAPTIYAALRKAQNDFNTKSINEIKEEAVGTLIKEGFIVDYFDIVHGGSLLPVHEKTEKSIALVAAYLGDIRLIDNLWMN